MKLRAGLHWIEADYPLVIEFKEGRLSGETPRCLLERVKIDLADAEQRRKLFSQVNSRFERVFVLTEGVVPYLSVEEAADLAADLRAQPNFRAWAIDYFSPQVAKYRNRPAIKKKMENAPFRFEPKDYFVFFREHSWQAKEEQYFLEVGTALHRPLPLPLAMRVMGALRAPFLSRERKEAFHRFAGYVLFVPA